jgi:hypothetical protein
VVQTVILLHLAVLARADLKTPLPPPSQVEPCYTQKTPQPMIFVGKQRSRAEHHDHHDPLVVDMRALPEKAPLIDMKLLLQASV